MKLSLSLSLAMAVACIAAPINNGKATFYYQNNTPGSCGVVHSDSAYLIARSPLNGFLNCWDRVTITNVGGGVNNYGVGNTIEAIVADTCPANECNANHLDLSTGAFMALSGGALDPPGAINIQWSKN